MSSSKNVFSLPYPEYLKAREELLAGDAASEVVRMRLLGDNSIGPKQSLLNRYSSGDGIAAAWYQSTWEQQYEMQGGVAC